MTRPRKTPASTYSFVRRYFSSTLVDRDPGAIFDAACHAADGEAY